MDSKEIISAAVLLGASFGYDAYAGSGPVGTPRGDAVVRLAMLQHKPMAPLPGPVVPVPPGPPAPNEKPSRPVDGPPVPPPADVDTGAAESSPAPAPPADNDADSGRRVVAGGACSVEAGGRWGVSSGAGRPRVVRSFRLFGRRR